MNHETAAQILAAAFHSNLSVNDTILNDSRRNARLLHLMRYSVGLGHRRNGLFVSDDGKSAAVFYDPSLKSNFLKETLAQLTLVHRAIGWRRLFYMLKKDKQVSSRRPAYPHYYLFLIGTKPDSQGSGSGSKLLNELLQRAQDERKEVYLETSVDKNIPFYEKRGFVTFDTWLVREGYLIRFMRWRPL
ncbi:MAG: GNAT family N-acetyltransferase [Bacteroidia bacterium]|jgi:GNAT superfamily N-acetyltransferase|nr:GNAT family N-acetyltransferase [Bacteroidia bacterium]